MVQIKQLPGVIWSHIKHLFTLFTFLIEGMLLLAKYSCLMGWYFIFTPKDAEYREDIPQLAHCYDQMNDFMTQYATYSLLRGLLK